MRRVRSESDSDSDSVDSEKEIVVRQLPVRHAVRSSPEQRPAELVHAEIESTLPSTEPNVVRNAGSPMALSNPRSLDCESSYDDEDNAYTPGSARSTFSVREEDIVIIMRSIPDYGQYTDAKGIDNDRYLRSALHNISEELLDFKDENGNTLLLIACQYSCEDLVRILLRRGADARVTNTSGANGLHFACYRDSLSIPIVELLLQHTVPVNVAENLYGCTPLHYAAGTGDLALCKLLIQHGAYIHAHDFDSCSSIDYAKDAGMFEVADYLTQELNALNATFGKPATSTQHADSQGDLQSGLQGTLHRSEDAAATPARANTSASAAYHGRASPTVTTGRFSTSQAATPAPTPQRFVMNNNSPSYDEQDEADGHNNHNDTHAPRTVYDFIAPKYEQVYEQQSGPGAGTGSVGATSDYSSSAKRDTKGSPGSASAHSVSDSLAGSTHSSPGNPISVFSPSTQPAASAKRGHQPTTASPYKPLSPSPVNASSTKNGAAKGFFIATDDLGGASGPNTVTSSLNGYPPGPQSQGSHSHLLSQSQAHSASSSSSAHTRHSEIPPLPTPTYNSPDGHYSDTDGCADLSPDKFEIYIERAKFNAKIAKERALNKDILSSKEGHIRSLQAEVNALKRTVGSYKEEVHSLNAKLDLMQLPFIETTNALQEELSALRAENKHLREQLNGKRS